MQVGLPQNDHVKETRSLFFYFSQILRILLYEIVQQGPVRIEQPMRDRAWSYSISFCQW